MKFIIIRHGETDWNANGILQGQGGVGLNEAGHKQAEEYADKLKSQDISRIISSDSARARETAAIIAERLKIPISFDARLRECSFGSLEGKPKSGLAEEYKAAGFGAASSNYDFHLFGGENKNEVEIRQIRLLDDVSRDNPSEVILLVGHGTALYTLLNFLGYDPNLGRGDFRVIDYP